MRWLRCTLVALAMVAGCAARGEVRIELPALPAPDPPPRVAVADVERTLQPERELEPADGGAQLGARYEIARAWVAEGRVTQAESLLAAEAPADAAHPLALPWAYALAWTRYALERYPEAIEALAPFDGFAHADSLTRAALSLLGDCGYQLGRAREAEQAYVRAAALLPDPPESLLRRQALVALAARSWETAAGLLGDLVLRFPDTAHGAEYNYWRAEAFRRLGRLAEARRHYRRAYMLGADPAACSAGLGWCDIREERWTDALARYEYALASCSGCPFLAELWRRHGDCLLQLGRTGDAEESFARAAAESLALLGGQGQLQPGWSLLRHEDWAGARAAFAQVRRREGRTATARAALYWESVAAFRQGLYEAAAAGFRDVLFDRSAADSLRARAQLGLGDCRMRLGDLGGAAEWYRGVLVSVDAAREVVRDALASLFECQAGLEAWDQAAALLSDLEQRFPEVRDLAERHLRVADGQWRARRWAAALAAYGEFLARAPAQDPRRLTVDFRIGRCHEELGELEVALTAFGALGDSTACRQRAEALLRVGALQLALGRPQAALAALERRLALGLDPAQTALTRARLAESYERLGERQAARNEWEKVAGAGMGASDSLRAVARRRLQALAERARDRE